MTTNRETFMNELARQYAELFKTPDYAFVAGNTTAEELAKTMTDGLTRGTANKDGLGIKRTCKALKLPYTYSAIEGYLK
jgi:hypothetical protein